MANASLISVLYVGDTFGLPIGHGWTYFSYGNFDV